MPGTRKEVICEIAGAVKSLSRPYVLVAPNPTFDVCLGFCSAGLRRPFAGHQQLHRGPARGAEWRVDGHELCGKVDLAHRLFDAVRLLHQWRPLLPLRLPPGVFRSCRGKAGCGVPGMEQDTRRLICMDGARFHLGIIASYGRAIVGDALWTPNVYHQRGDAQLGSQRLCILIL